jgi:hypothetical protein
MHMVKGSEIRKADYPIEKLLLESSTGRESALMIGSPESRAIALPPRW